MAVRSASFLPGGALLFASALGCAESCSPVGSKGEMGEQGKEAETLFYTY